MTLLIQILIALAAIVVIMIGIVAMRPSDFRISRSKLVSAPPSAAFALVNDHHYWGDWSPWEKQDPDLKKTYEGPTSGVGAIYRWSGNNKVGEGSNTITESRPSEVIRMKLEFLRPFKATNAVEFTFQPQNEQTLVTWTMTGRYNFMAKAMGLFMNMGKMIGDSFDEGLTKLKSLVERT